MQEKKNMSHLPHTESAITDIHCKINNLAFTQKRQSQNTSTLIPDLD